MLHPMMHNTQKPQDTKAYLKKMLFSLKTHQQQLPLTGIELFAYDTQNNRLAYTKQQDAIIALHVFSLPITSASDSFSKSIDLPQNFNSTQQLRWSPLGNYILFYGNAHLCNINHIACNIYDVLIFDCKNKNTKIVKNTVAPVEFSRNEQYFCSIFIDEKSFLKYCAVYALETLNEPLYKKESMAQDFKLAALSDDGSYVIAIKDGQATITNVATAETLCIIALTRLSNSALYVLSQLPGETICCQQQVSLHTPVRRIAIPSDKNSIKITAFDSLTTWLQAIMQRQSKAMQSITYAALSNNGNFIATAALNNTIVLWDTKTKRSIFKSKQRHPIKALFFSNNDSLLYIITGHYNTYLQLPRIEKFATLTQEQRLFLFALYKQFKKDRVMFLSNNRENELYFTLPAPIKEIIGSHITLYIPEQWDCLWDIVISFPWLKQLITSNSLSL